MWKRGKSSAQSLKGRYPDGRSDGDPYVSTGSDVVMTTVPEVLGMDIRTAASMLTGKNLKYDYDLVESDKPKDEVIEQDQAKGTEVPEGTVVKLKVSKGTCGDHSAAHHAPTTETGASGGF